MNIDCLEIINIPKKNDALKKTIGMQIDVLMSI